MPTGIFLGYFLGKSLAVWKSDAGIRLWGGEYQDVVKCHFLFCWQGVAKSCCEPEKSPELSISWGNLLQRQQEDMKELVLRIWNLWGASWHPQWFHNLGPFFLLFLPDLSVAFDSLLPPAWCISVLVCMKSDLPWSLLPPVSLPLQAYPTLLSP